MYWNISFWLLCFYIPYNPHNENRNVVPILSQHCVRESERMISRKNRAYNILNPYTQAIRKVSWNLTRLMCDSTLKWQTVISERSTKRDSGPIWWFDTHFIVIDVVETRMKWPPRIRELSGESVLERNNFLREVDTPWYKIFAPLFRSMIQMCALYITLEAT